jgi:type III pantothenate kinase
MKPDVVVDVGNTRIKWGRCSAAGVTEVVSLPPDDAPAWDAQLAAWRLTETTAWALAGVHPARQDRFLEWLEQRRQRVFVLTSHNQLPMRIRLAEPERVGIDRLLNAVAAGSRALHGALIVDVGSAVTIDLVEERIFLGGVIFPGLRLMAKALHDYTALLPLVDLPEARPSALGVSTTTAIQAGIYYAVLGAINYYVDNSEVWYDKYAVFLTGGDAPLFRDHMIEREVPTEFWPEMTLEGIRIAAEAQP